jgi:hypothetical protein
LAEVTYEVYVLVSGRWTIESRYTNMERDVAIEDAKSMHSNPHVKAAKVIKETYDQSTNSTIEAIVFTTESVVDLDQGRGGGGGFADMEIDVGGGTDFSEMEFDLNSVGNFDDPLPSRKSKPKKKAKPAGKSPIGTIFLKIMMITAFSLGFAFLMTYLNTEGFFG